MAFANSILAGTYLVRPAIQSPNYQPGVAGWTINADGTAEFNDATFRGVIRIGNPAIIIDAADGIALPTAAPGNYTDNGRSVRWYPVGNEAATSGRIASANGVTRVFGSQAGIHSFLNVSQLAAEMLQNRIPGPNISVNSIPGLPAAVVRGVSNAGSHGVEISTGDGSRIAIEGPAGNSFTGSGLAFQNTTTAVGQGIFGPISVSYSRTLIVGNFALWNFAVTIGAGGWGAGSAVTVHPAFAIAALGSVMCGIGQIYDASTNTRYVGSWERISTNAMGLVGDWSGGSFWGGQPAIALAAGDIVRGMVVCEIA